MLGVDPPPRGASTTLVSASMLSATAVLGVSAVRSADGSIGHGLPSLIVAPPTVARSGEVTFAGAAVAIAGGPSDGIACPSGPVAGSSGWIVGEANEDINNAATVPVSSGASIAADRSARRAVRAVAVACGPPSDGSSPVSDASTSSVALESVACWVGSAEFFGLAGLAGLAASGSVAVLERVVGSTGSLLAGSVLSPAVAMTVSMMASNPPVGAACAPARPATPRTVLGRRSSSTEVFTGSPTPGRGDERESTPCEAGLGPGRNAREVGAAARWKRRRGGGRARPARRSARRW